MSQESEENEAPVTAAFNTALKVGAYPAAAIAGWAAFDTYARDKIYGNVAQTGYFAQIKKEKKLEPLLKELHNADKSGAYVPDIMARINEDYRQLDVRPHFERWGFLNAKDYWKGLNRNQKVEGLVFAVTAGAIILGVTLTAANSKGLFDVFSHRKKHGDDSSTPSR